MSRLQVVFSFHVLFCVFYFKLIVVFLSWNLTAGNAFQNKNKPVLNSQHKRERVTMDGEKRVKQNRMNLMHTMETLYSTVIQVCSS